MGVIILIIPNIDSAVSEISKALKENPRLKKQAADYGNLYQGERGLMIVDVVASRQRRYESYVRPKILPQYRSKAKDLSLLSLSFEPPRWLPLRDGEADTMKLLAKALIDFGKSKELTDEEVIVKEWAEDENAHQAVLDIKGIGPALLQYLRMRSGADSLKVDVRVIEGLKGFGIPVHWFTAPGLLELCREIAKESKCSLLELDQVLWHLDLLEKRTT